MVLALLLDIEFVPGMVVELVPDMVPGMVLVYLPERIPAVELGMEPGRQFLPVLGMVVVPGKVLDSLLLPDMDTVLLLDMVPDMVF